MSAIQALAGFTAWTLLLVILVFLYRGARFVTGTPINHWPRSRKPTDDMPLVKRIEDAHANCCADRAHEGGIRPSCLSAISRRVYQPAAPFRNGRLA